MAFCNIQSSLLGKKLDRSFYTGNRNTIANILETEEFKAWFGQGKLDNQGNPFLDETFSFINEQKEKRTVFDFDIRLKNSGEVKKVLVSSPAIHLYKSELFINNTKKDPSTGAYSAKNAVKLINTLNYYYPNLLSIQIFNREGLGQYSKDKSIPLPIIRVNENIDYSVPKPMFSVHETNVSKNAERFAQITSPQALTELKDSMDEFRQYGITPEEVAKLTNMPEISEKTYDKLVQFLKKINPEFKIETLSDLSDNGISYINEFLIQLNENTKFRAMPEEVAHFFVELMPDDHPLKRDLLNNITNFAIYGLTLKTYGNNPLYQKNGKTNYDKIKREAAAKLIAEYVYAITEDDHVRVNELTKVKQGFIQKWWDRFLEMIRSIFNVQKKDRLIAYFEAANAILEQNMSYTTAYPTINDPRDNIFLQIKEGDKLRIAKGIIAQVNKKGNVEKLQEIIDQFRNDLRKNYIKVVSEKGVEALKIELQKDPNRNDTEINYLSELYDVLKNVNITDVLSAENQVKNMSEFLDVVINMEKLADAINYLVSNYTDTKQYEQNIVELQSYREIYANFVSLVNNDLLSFLAGTDIGIAIQESIASTTTKFEVLENNIIKKMRENFEVWWKSKLTPQNTKILQTYTADLKNTLKPYLTDVNQTAAASNAIGQYGTDLQNGMVKRDAAKKLKLALDNLKVPRKVLNGPVIAQIIEKIEELYTTDQFVTDMMRGLGKDIDGMSAASHWVTAGIKNRDVFVSNIAKYIVDKRSAAQNSAVTAIRGMQSRLDPILKELKALGLDEYKSGKGVTYIDRVVDKSTKKDGSPEYEDGFREIIKFYAPTTNEANIEKDALFDNKNKAMKAWNASDKNSAEGKKLRQEYKAARRKYLDLLDTYFNSPYTKDLRDFQNKWNADEDFLDIKDTWDELSDQIRYKEDAYEKDKTNQKFFDEIAQLRRDRSLLLSEKNKTPDEVRQVQKLKEFFDGSSKFRVEDTRRTQRNYNLARNNYESKVDYALAEFYMGNDKSLEALENTLRRIMKDNTINIKYKYRFTAETNNDDVEEGSRGSILDTERISGSPELMMVKEILMDDFEERNLVKVRNDAYFERIEKLYADIEKLKKAQGLSEVDTLVSDMYKEINEILIDRKDAYGQKNPKLLTPEERRKVENLENKLNVIRRLNTRTYKILDEAKTNPRNRVFLQGIAEYERKVSRFSDLMKDWDTLTQNVDEIEELRKDIYESNQIFEDAGIITKMQKDIATGIRDLYREIGALTSKPPTQLYWDRMEEILPLFERMLEDRQKELQNPAKPLSERDRRVKNLDIATITGLIDGISQAIYTQNHKLLDKILNDEYYVGDIPIDFKQYVEPADPLDPTGLSPIEYYAIEGLSDDAMNNPDSNFYMWFQEAHKPDSVFVNFTDEITGEELDTGNYEDREYTRRLIYTHSEPVDSKYYDVKVAKKYRATKIDEQYRAKPIRWDSVDANGKKYDMEDWTVDNREARPGYLPMSRKQLQAEGKKDFKYINKDYYKLKDGTDAKSKALTNYLNTSIDVYLGEQANKPDELKSYLNIPVTNLDSYQRLEVLATNPGDRIKRFGQKITDLFGKNRDIAAENELAGITQIRDVDEYTQESINNKVPRLGTNVKLPVERTNRNTLHALTMYISKSKDFDARENLNPLVKGLIDVMHANESSQHVNQKQRTDIFEKIYEQMILEELPDNQFTNNAFFRKLSSNIMGLTAMKLTADVLGGGINYIQANINNIIETFAKKYVTPTNYAIGYAKASHMMANMFTDYYKKDNFSYWTMMFQTFDFVQGEWLDDLQERSSSKNKTFDMQRHLMLPRKNGELHAQSAMAIGILDHEKVPNDDGKLYPMWDIYKKEGNQLVLKAGFNHEAYNPVNGTEFERVKQLIWAVNIDLHGNYAKINQTQASRYSIGKLAENMKRWFVSGFQRRFGRESFDVSKQDIDQGYYLTTALAVGNFFRAWAKGGFGAAKDQFRFYWTTPRKAENLRRTATDLITAGMLFFLTSFVFGYDEDDPDKNKKLRKSSYLYNEALLLFLRTYAEQTAFIPVPPFGFTEMTRNLLDPLSVIKSTFTNAAGSFSLAVFTLEYYLLGDPFNWESKVIYSRDSGAGKGPQLPWFWDITPGEKGELKLVKYLANTFGYTGSQVDPANYIKNYEQLQNRLK